MSHFNFIICKEHKFFGNIFSNDELSKTDALKDLKTFHGKFVRFLRVVVFLQNSFKIKDELMSADCSDFGEIKDLISSAKKKKIQSLHCRHMPLSIKDQWISHMEDLTMKH